MQTIDITLPTSWQELTQKQLREVFTLLALDLDFEEIRAMCLMKWAGISPEYSETDDAVIIRYTDEKHRIGERLPALPYSSCYLVFYLTQTSVRQ